MGILKFFRKKVDSERKFDNKVEVENQQTTEDNKHNTFFNGSTFISVKDKKKYLNKINKPILDIDKLVDDNNKKFIENQLVINKEYLDHVLDESDPNIKLDNEQRIAVLSDEDYTLIVAGAGAGKTTTVAAKVKYLVEKKEIDPKKILVISFTNKAVNELKTRINKVLKIDCAITTFHSTGNAIIRKTQSDKPNIATEGFMYNVIRQFFREEVFLNDDLLKKIIIFFSYHINCSLEGKSLEEVKQKLSMTHYTTLKSSIEEITKGLIKDKSKSLKTILNESVRSIEELTIANYLYLNGIEYHYEEPYEYQIKGARKTYTPDFTIVQGNKKCYLEHFGITEDGKHSYYTKDELEKYINSIKDKIEIHKNHGTNLIYTYSKFNDGRNLLDDIKSKLQSLGFELNPKDNKEVYATLIADNDIKYFDKFIKLLINFINNFKTSGYNEQSFIKLKKESNNERNKVFLDIAQQAYLFYQQKLLSNNYLDFQDLINNSTMILDELKDRKDLLDFKYIIVDEYQDISLQRFNLTKRLSEITDAKIIAVGDDWQSIYAFSGARLSLFTQFKEEMGYANILKITHTYRNSQELIDIAGKFIQSNDSQIKKQLISPKRLPYPVAIFTYSDDQSKNASKGKSGILEEKAKVINEVFKVIIKRQKKQNSSILLIGRYGFDALLLGQTSTFTYDFKTGLLKSTLYPLINITFMTAHSSKGLGYDDVIIINGEEGTYGFPSQVVDDPVLKLVTAPDDKFDFAEERRLFYVALTRTKNRVYLIVPKSTPSRFVLELLKENKDSIYLDDKSLLNSKITEKKKYLMCPNCGFPLRLVSKAQYSRKIYTCSNDPEICDFITNDLHGGKTRIRKCDCCTSGYLLIKKKKENNRYFLGCSNYRVDGKGCNNAINLDFDNCSDDEL